MDKQEEPRRASKTFWKSITINPHHPPLVHFARQPSRTTPRLATSTRTFCAFVSYFKFFFFLVFKFGSQKNALICYAELVPPPLPLNGAQLTPSTSVRQQGKVGGWRSLSSSSECRRQEHYISSICPAQCWLSFCAWWNRNHWHIIMHLP